MTMKTALTEQDLKAAITSTVRRQHLLGAYPGAMVALPITAIAIGDLFAHSLGKNVIEEFLCGPDHTQIQLQSPSKELQDPRSPSMGSTLVDSCRLCSRMYPHSVLSHTVRSGSMLELRWSWRALTGGSWHHIHAQYFHVPKAVVDGKLRVEPLDSRRVRSRSRFHMSDFQLLSSHLIRTCTTQTFHSILVTIRPGISPFTVVSSNKIIGGQHEHVHYGFVRRVKHKTSVYRMLQRRHLDVTLYPVGGWGGEMVLPTLLAWA